MREAVREALIERGGHVPAPEPVRALYRQAFDRFEALSLWNVAFQDDPTLASALGVARQLRVEGNMAARRLAIEIERACDAAV